MFSVSEDFNVESLCQAASLVDNSDSNLGCNASSWGWNLSQESLCHAGVNIGKYPSRNIGKCNHTVTVRKMVCICVCVCV